MLNKVKDWLRQEQLLNPGDTVIVACSGGADSTALLFVLAELAESFALDLKVAYAHHGLRPEADQEALIVEKLSHQLGFDYFCEKLPVRDYALKRKLSLEEAARILRYSFLFSLSRQFDFAKVATGHHKQDQAETVLMNFLRGSGSRGLRGMPGGEGVLIRPLLNCRKEELIQYCHQKGYEPCEDESNEDQRFLRNRIRHDLMPHLKQKYNPNMESTLGQLAEIMRDEYEFLRQTALEKYNLYITPGEKPLIGRSLLVQPKAVQRELVRLCLEKKRGHLQGFTFDHVERILQLLEDDRPAEIQLPGSMYARRTYQGILLTDAPLKLSPGIEPPGVVLEIPGKTSVHPLGVVIESNLLPYNAVKGVQSNICFFDADELVFPLHIRTRLPGDRFKPLGLLGTQKLKEFFINNKVPQEQRDKIPLIYNEQGILWIAGQRQGDIAPLSSHTKLMLKLELSVLA